MADLSELEGLKIELKQVTKEALQLKRDGDLEGAKARVKSIRALKDRIEELEESQPTPDNSAAAAEAAANQARFDELNARITALSKEAVALKRADDMAGAVAKAKEVKELKAELAELEAESSGATAEAVETERDIAEQAAAMDDVGEVEALIKKTTKQALAKKKAGKTAEAVADMKKIKILQARVEEINAAEEAAAAAAAAAAEAAAARAAEDAAAAAAAAEAAEAARAARPPSEPPVDVAGGSSATTETASVSTTTTTTTTAAATAAVTAGAAGGSSSAAGGGVVVEDVVEETTTTTTTVTAAASGSSTPAASDGAADEAVAAEEPAPAVVPAPDPHFWEVVLPDPMPPGRDDAIYRDDVNKLDQDFADHRERVGRYIRWREPFVEGFVPPASTAPQITVNIYRSDGTFTPVVIHRDWTFQTILQVYANATELRLIEPFALKHRAPLVPYMDPAYVRPKFFQMYATAAMEDIEDGAELEIRIRFFKLLKPQSDAEALRLIFLQCHRMVLEDIFRYDMKYAVRFAAYFVQQQIGDFDPQRHAPGFLDATMDKLFSPSFLSQRDSRYLQMRVFKTHAQLLGVNAKTAHYSYIATCLTLPTFGGIFYEVETENPDGSMQPCLLGLVHDGVLLYDKGADYPWEFTYWAEIMSYTLDNDTGSFDWTVKIDENTTGVVSVVCDRGQVNKIRENLHDYCALAMLMEKSGEYQTLGTFGPSPKRFLPPATLFVRPPRRLLDSGHLSQTMHFVDTYVDLCRAQNDTPHMSIIRAAENAQDMNDSWKILDLTISNPDVDHLVILGNSFQVNSEYTDGVKDVAITDIIYSRLPFGVDVPSVRKACRVIENIGLYCGIQTLHLSRCGIDGTQEWQAITNAIGRCSALTDLDLSYNEMLPEAMATLNRSIAPETGQRLKKLDVTNCALVDEAAAPLGGILHNMRDTLITIKAGRNNWTDRGLKVILAHYKKNTVAHELDLTGATWGKESLKILDELLRMEHGSVTNWYIGGIDVQKKQAKLLAEALETTYLTKLDLRNSAIKGKMMQKFIPLIPESHLIYLNLSGNQFDKGCTKAMVAVLASSGCKLQEFLLRSCELPIKLAKAIIGSLEHNATLYKLDLADNGLNSEIAEAIVAAVRMNTSLRHLVLSFNPIGNAGTKALAPLLEENGSCLEQFEMVQVGMKDGGVAALGVALETNVWLKELHVEQNSMGKNGFIHLIKSLKENTCLREVHVRGNDDETIADLLPKLPPIKAKVVI